MAIFVKCKCGKGFSAKDEMRGKKAKCPACGEVLIIDDGARPPATSAPTAGSSAAPSTASIPLRCSCGKTLAAPAKLAGKTVKCPACAKPIAVPGGVAKPDDLSDLLDEIGYDQEKTQDSCQECGVTMPPGAILCVSCGYNTETGKKLRTKSYSELSKQRNNRTKLH